MTRQGYKCPKCGQTDGFQVIVDCAVSLTIDGQGEVYDRDVISDGEIFGTDTMECRDCGYEAPTHHFIVEEIIGLPMVIERQKEA